MNISIMMIAALAHATGPAAPEVIVPVSVGGEAPLSPDVEWTLKEAKRAARTKALESGAASLVRSHVILRYAPAQIDELAATVKGAIVDEQWGDLVPGATTATIALQARVNVSAVERALCDVVKANHDPKVTLVVVERAGAGARWSNDGVTHPLLEAAFTDACFTVVARVPLTEVSATGDASPEELKRIVHDHNAQYVIVAAAEAVAEAVAEKDTPDAWRASLRVKAINTATDWVDAASSSTTVVQGGTAAAALSRALSTPVGDQPPMIPFVMNDLMKRIVPRWFDYGPVNSGRIQVVVTESQGETAAKAIAAVMTKVLGEHFQVELRSVKGQLRYDVTVDGGAEYFATVLEGKAVGKKFIEIIEVSRGKVIMKLSTERPRE